jgi:hypothetical protein
VADGRNGLPGVSEMADQLQHFGIQPQILRRAAARN